MLNTKLFEALSQQVNDIICISHRSMDTQITRKATALVSGAVKTARSAKDDFESDFEDDTHYSSSNGRRNRRDNSW